MNNKTILNPDQKSGRGILLTIAYLYNNNWPKMYEHIKSKKPLSDDDYNFVTSLVNPDDFICIIDKDFPEELKTIPMPPFIILLNESNQKTFKDRSSKNFIKLMSLLSSNKKGLN